MSLEAKLQEGSQEFQKLQIDMSKVVEARQRLDAQLSENELVKKVSLGSLHLCEVPHFSNRSSLH